MTIELDYIIKSEIIRHDALVIGVNLIAHDENTECIARDLNRVLYHGDTSLKLNPESMNIVSNFLENHFDTMTNEEKEIFYTYAKRGERLCLE